MASTTRTPGDTVGRSTDRSREQVLPPPPVPSRPPIGHINMRVVVQDEIYDLLENRSQQSGRPIEIVAQQLLGLAARSLPQGGRVVVLTGDDLHALEDRLAGGSILSPGDLRAKVDRLAGIGFYHTTLPFTPSQLEHLKVKAERQGKTVEQLIEEAAPKIYEQFFGLLPAEG